MLRNLVESISNSSLGNIFQNLLIGSQVDSHIWKLLYYMFSEIFEGIVRTGKSDLIHHIYNLQRIRSGILKAPLLIEDR